MAFKKDIRQYVCPIILLDGERPRVLLVAEKDSKQLMLPEIELDSKTTMHDAILTFFEKVVPLNVDVEDVFRIYNEEDDDGKIQYTTFIASILPEDNKDISFNKQIDSNEKFIDIAIFYDIEKAIDNSQLKDETSHVKENTGIILAHVFDEFYGEDEEVPEEIPESPENELDEETEEINEAIEKIAIPEVLDEKSKFLKKYDESRKDNIEEVNFEDVVGKTIVEPKIINIASAEKVVLMFKDVKNLKLTIEGNSVIDCLVTKKDNSKIEPPKEP